MSDEKLIISHSEVTSNNECQRQHFYAYTLNLRPRVISDPLQYGINGHFMLEDFYTVLRDKGSYVEAMEAAFNRLKKIKDSGDIALDVASRLDFHMQKYFYRYRSVVEEWEIIEVEKTLVVPLPDKPYDYGCKLDLIALFKDGKHRGKIGIVDHKFTYNFYTIGDTLLNVQLPRYKWAANRSGYKIDFGLLAQIRYRPFKDYSKADLFKHEPFGDDEMPLARLENSMVEFFKSADEIHERRQLSQQEALAKVKRTLSKQVCKNCDFQNPCNTGLNGHSEHDYLISDYKPSDYGYNIKAVESAVTNER